MMKKISVICALAIASLMCASVLWASAIDLTELDLLIGEGAKDDLEARTEIETLLDNEWAKALLRIYDNTKLFETMDRIFPQSASFPADLRLGSNISPSEASMLLRTGFPQPSTLASEFDTDAERKAYERWQRMFSSLEPTLFWLFNDEFYSPLMERYGLFGWLATNEGALAYNALITARDDLPGERPDKEMRAAIEQFTSRGVTDATEIFNAWARDIFSDRLFKSVTISEAGNALEVRAVLSSGFYAKIAGSKKYFTKAIDGAQSFRDMVGRLQSIRDTLKSAADGVADIAGGACPLPDIAANVRALQTFSTAFDRFFTEHVMNGYHSLDASSYNKMLKDVLEDTSLFRDPMPKIIDAMQRVMSDSLKRSFSGVSTMVIAYGN